MMLATSGNEEDFAMESCAANEHAFMLAREGEVNFYYLYVTQFKDLDELRVICHYLLMKPTTPKFLHHYVVRMGSKFGWVSLKSLLNTRLFTTPKFLHHYVVRMGSKFGWVSLKSLLNTRLFTT
ncbi:hypothetical protein CR513_26437, partial [Mucuna pruriens]